MATTESDYYDVLGVPRNASDADLKRAFRNLARELHPDVSSEPDADVRFREVVEAYEVLSKSETRDLYDRYGHAGLRGGGFTPGHFDFGSVSDIFAAFFGEDFLGAGGGRQRSQRGADVQAVVEIDLGQAFTGATVTVPLDVALPCQRCETRGAEPGTGTRACSTCGGSGMVRSVTQNIFGQFVQQRACPECGGLGEILEQLCRDCGGEGRIVRQHQLEVDVPKGIHDGQQIRVRGEGHAGFRSVERGHAFVAVHVRPDPRFLREGDDLHTALRLTMTEAALGTTATVSTLGGDVDLEIPAGTQPGEVRALRGQGMPALSGPGRGSLHVRLDVAVPTALGEDERRLLEQLDEKLDDEAYAQRDDDEGFFSRLKSALR
jgi:molecular chaperone DnaJ